MTKLYTNTDLKFSFNPFTKDFIICYGLHSTGLRGKCFKEYIRGVIINNDLYIRAYYPFDQEDIRDLSLEDLYSKSKKILAYYIKDLLRKIKKEYNLIPVKIIYNADNDLKIKDIS